MGKKPKSIRIDGDVAYVPLTKGYEAMIDAADASLCGQFNWRTTIDPRNVYAGRSSERDENGKQKNISLHRFIMGFPDGQVDHINGNGLDNRRCNLRVVSVSQNACNRRTPANNAHGLKGVGWDNSAGKFRARIMVNGKRVHLGHFETADTAYDAYAKAAAEMHGEFARVPDYTGTERAASPLGVIAQVVAEVDA